MNIRREAQDIQNYLVKIRRELHQFPELKMNMVKTKEIILKYLDELGVTDIQTGIGGNGIVAMVCGDIPGKCLGIRADCDGLPIVEETGLPFASTNGNMHACGHDAHTAMALGTIKLLSQHRSELKGSVKVVFQPYEEGGEGAKAMIADGVLTSPPVDSMVCVHIGNMMGPKYKAGDLIYRAGAFTAASRAFRLYIKGKGAHAASPHMSHDALLCSCNIVVAIQSLISRETKPGKVGIASITKINAGTRNNIIPDQCEMEGSIRSYSSEEQNYYFRRIGEIAKNVASAFNCTAEIEMLFDVPPIINNEDLAKRFEDSMKKIVDQNKLRVLEEPMAGADDFAYYSELLPSLYFNLCSAFGDNRDYPHHSSKFDIDESVLWIGSAAFTQFALDWQNSQSEFDT